MPSEQVSWWGMEGPGEAVLLYRDSGYPLEKEDLYVNSGKKDVVIVRMPSLQPLLGYGRVAGSWADPSIQMEMEAWEMLSMESWMRDDREGNENESVAEGDGR